MAEVCTDISESPVTYMVQGLGPVVSIFMV